MTNLDWALKYASLGWKVFPLSENSKITIKGSNGFKDASSDENTIRNLWKNSINSNIGVEADSVGLILDIDKKDNKNGFIPLAALESQYEDLPTTAVQITPSGGKQFLFSLPPNTVVPCSRDKLGHGIDIRSTGGYFVAPPSFLRKTTDYKYEGSYDWVSDQSPFEIKIAEAPKWLIDLAICQGEKKKLELTETISKGGRNDTLFKFACKLRTSGMNYSEILSAVIVLNKRCCPPLPDSEVEIIVKSATKYDIPKHDIWTNINLEIINKKPICNADNTLRVISAMTELKDKIWFDDFHRKIYTSMHTGVVREWSDIETIDLLIFIQRVVGLNKLGKESVIDAVTNYANKNIKNEPKDWIRSLTWDGISRIGEFFIKCANAVDTPYIRAVSHNFWVSMMARLFNPGCQVDNMVILEGKQGTFKSSLFNKIGGKFYSEAAPDVRSVEFYKCLEGKIIVEFAELSSFSRSEVNIIKKMITCRVDRYRASYARFASDFPRTCILTGSTNDETYLTDPTGARRFWPVETNNINLSYIGEFREQLFAEAFHRYSNSENWWNVPEEETKSVQDERRVFDEWENIVIDHIKERDFITINDVASKLGIPHSQLDKSVQMRIANIIRLSGIFKKDREFIDNKIIRGWRKLTTYAGGQGWSE